MAQIHLPLIAWDVDDVMNSLMQRWLEDKWLPTHPRCSLRYEMITQNPPHQLLGVSLEEYLQSLDEYRQENYRFLEPKSTLLNWFEHSGAGYRHVVITAVPIQAAHVSAEWVFRHFGQWVRGFFMAPTPRSEKLIDGYPAKKQDIFESWVHPDIFIDDNPTNIHQAKVCNIETALIKTPWSRFGDEWITVASKLRQLKEKE